jgi:Regulator of chromosome condensation (RCC1) repeat
VSEAVDTSGALAGKTLTQITAGADHECALDTAGAAYCWGDHTAGELRNGSHATVPQPPVAVGTSGVLAGKTLTQISTGWQSTASWTAQERRTAGGQPVQLLMRQVRRTAGLGSSGIVSPGTRTPMCPRSDSNQLPTRVSCPLSSRWGQRTPSGTDR